MTQVAEAKKFLAESSYGSAGALPEITLMVPPRDDWVQAAEVIQQMWQDNLGVKVNLVTQERKVFFDTLATDPPQVWRLGWITRTPTTLLKFSIQVRSSVALNGATPLTIS